MARIAINRASRFDLDVDRPRILLVPDTSELEWQVKPLLEEWAEVASFDAPGIGAEPAVEGRGPRATLEGRGLSDERRGWERCVTPGDEPIVERGLAEIDRRGWESCIVVGDEFGSFNAIGLAAAAPSRVEGLALGHACLSLDRTGPRPPVSGDVYSGFSQLARFDYRTFARTLTQVTQGGYDEELAEAYIERVPQEITMAHSELADRFMDGRRVEPVLRELNVPLLLVEHKGCLMFTREGFEDAVAAFPDAQRAAFEQKPSVSADFAAALRTFAARLTKAAREPAKRPG
jgi:pimeloyl-ACP methyl ester carboxylesterase